MFWRIRRTNSLLPLLLPAGLLASQMLAVIERVSAITPSVVQDDDGVTALMRAARDGEKKDLEALLKHGVDVNARDKYGWSALIYASARGDLSNVKALLEAKADVNAQGEGQYAALMAAVQYDHDSTVKLLLSKGANPNAATKEGKTALGFASGRKRTIETLKNAGAKEQMNVPKPVDPLLGTGTKPVLLNSPSPSYTSKAREEKVQGKVYLRVLIAADGSVKKARVLVGLPCGLSYQAIEAAHRLLFKPATVDGKPVLFWQNVEVEFHLR